MTKTQEGKSPDDFEATRQVIATLEPFENPDRERILRWAREKLKMGAPPLPGHTRTPDSPPPGGHDAGRVPGDQSGAAGATQDIKSFIKAKDPKSGTQFAATAAYYNRFLAPEAERKETISATELLDAYRKAEMDRPKKPGQTLIDAFADGVFDKADRGTYKLNTVGENLVAMVLPGKEGASSRLRAGRGRKRSRGSKKSAKKSAKGAAKKTAKKAAKRARP
jgi:hypothetical protein